jgi:pimeloyl-ACP methyl ester carboxylesterase
MSFNQRILTMLKNRSVQAVLVIALVGAWWYLSREPDPSFAETTIEERMVPVIIDGEQVRLAVRIYRPVIEEPLPTLIFHHGSTGSGRDPARFDAFQSFEPVVTHFVRRGFAVILPSRRGRGGSEGLYDEGFRPSRDEGYACASRYSLPGAERALTDLDAITDAVLAMPFVDETQLVVGGVSRGGILSVAHAGRHPDRYRGVLNFVGGWVGERCDEAISVNQTLFRMGVPRAGETLWLYADQDPTYSLAHSKASFAAFRGAGGNGSFHSEFSRPAGHGLANDAGLWANAVDAYLNRHGLPFARIGPGPFPRFGADPTTPNTAFVGHWSGSWGGTLPSTLDISAIDADGRVTGAYIFDGRSFPLDGLAINQGVLRFGTAQTGITEFFVARDNTIRGTWRDRATITLRRQ